jgi:hypothetical protein
VGEEMRIHAGDGKWVVNSQAGAFPDKLQTIKICLKLF